MSRDEGEGFDHGHQPPGSASRFDLRVPAGASTTGLDHGDGSRASAAGNAGNDLRWITMERGISHG